jgi:small subunit ribosomal protein S17
MSETQTPNNRRAFTGTVVSTKMDKTLVVRVDRTVVHPKYGKRFIQSKKFHVHDEQNSHKVGDVVAIKECQPLSKTKRWSVVNV